MMQRNLSRREREILEIIYRHGEATANQVAEALPDALANATVRTLLRTLEAKGAIKHRVDGKRFKYKPCVPRKSAATTAFLKVLDVFFGGSVEDAIAAHLADPKTRLNAKQIKRLRELIDQKSKEGA